MTSSKGNIFRVPGPLYGEFTGNQWIPLIKASDAEFDVFFICAWANSWTSNGDAGDLRRHRAHHGVTIALQWRHNEHDGVSNHQPHDFLLNRLFRRRWEKTSKLCVTGFCEGNSPVTKGQVRWIVFSFHDNIKLTTLVRKSHKRIVYVDIYLWGQLELHMHNKLQI